jgi:hypothetical protein
MRHRSMLLPDTRRARRRQAWAISLSLRARITAARDGRNRANRATAWRQKEQHRRPLRRACPQAKAELAVASGLCRSGDR